MATPPANREPPVAEPVAEEEEPMLDPVHLWKDGRNEGYGVDASRPGSTRLILELGEDWTPYLFSEADGSPNSYRATYLALARGDFPDNHHGHRARRDKYLELYGIPPTLGLIKERMDTLAALPCVAELDLSHVASFEGFLAYQSNEQARRDAREFAALETQVSNLVRRAQVASAAELDHATLEERERNQLLQYRAKKPIVDALRAAQARLQCEGYFEGKGRYIDGAFDWATHEALAEFERRHRVYGWGFFGRDTLEVLKVPPLEGERQTLVRILTERAVHARGVIEDGSAMREGEEGPVRTFVGADGVRHEYRNLEEELEQAVISAFGLQTVGGAQRFMASWDEMRPNGVERCQSDESIRFAIEVPELPEYYSESMNLSVEIDRGDVWYEFPYDELGQERAQPVSRRPRTSIFTEYRGQRIPLARFGTTIGGWRTESIGGVTMWKYKQSEVGPRVWARIVAAPVWLPPESTPAKDLLSRDGRGGFTVNRHETGPSYASAYGLVAAYHQLYREGPDGISVGGDEGIRSHGSVDYMSIMRRHSHGCHRLHNHIAVRLMSFVLAHRPHRRRGERPIEFKRYLEHEGQTYALEVDDGGYEFELIDPVRVNVLEGRILGARRTPIVEPLPRYNPELLGYVTAEGQYVAIDRLGTMTPIEPPPGAPPIVPTLVPGDAGVEEIPAAISETPVDPDLIEVIIP